MGKKSYKDLRKNRSSLAVVEFKDYLLTAILFLISFVAYIKTLCPNVYEGDSGELLAAAATLGIAHPTGFPLYMLLSKLFIIILPFDNIAYKVKSRYYNLLILLMQIRLFSMLVV